jgi:hypothetical protein
MIEAIGLPRERLCLYCWNGEYKHRPPRRPGREGAGEEIVETADA